MKGFAALAVLALLVASTVYGQAVKEDGVKYSGKDNTPVGFYGSDDSTSHSVTSNDGLPVALTNSGVFSFLNSTTPIVDDTTAVGMADSSAVIDVRQYRSFALIVKAIAPASNFVRLAIQVRYHVAGLADSNSTAPVLFRETFTASATVDSNMTLGSVTVPTAVAAGSDEFVVVIPTTNAVASKWTASNVRAFPILTRTGAYSWVDYISVRIRVLSAGANTPHVTAYLRAGS